MLSPSGLREAGYGPLSGLFVTGFPSFRVRDGCPSFMWAFFPFADGAKVETLIFPLSLLLFPLCLHCPRTALVPISSSDGVGQGLFLISEELTCYCVLHIRSQFWPCCVWLRCGACWLGSGLPVSALGHAGPGRDRPTALPNPEVWVCWPVLVKRRLQRRPVICTPTSRCPSVTWPPGPPSASVTSRSSRPQAGPSLPGGLRAPVCACASQGAVFSECEDGFHGCVAV